MAWQPCCLIESTFEPHTSPPHSPTINRVWFLDEGNAICIIHIFNGQLHWNVHCKYAKLRLIKWCILNKIKTFKVVIDWLYEFYATNEVLCKNINLFWSFKCRRIYHINKTIISKSLRKNMKDFFHEKEQQINYENKQAE
eukprot:940869_1